MGAREYDPKLGRFLSVDPVIDPMDPQQMNGYAYANNSPVTASDPSGLFAESGCASCDAERLSDQSKANGGQGVSNPYGNSGKERDAVLPPPKKPKPDSIPWYKRAGHKIASGAKATVHVADEAFKLTVFDYTHASAAERTSADAS